MNRTLRLFFIAVASPILVSAHDLYLLPDLFQVQKGATLRIAVHNGDSFPASEAAPVIGRLEDAQLLGVAGVAAVRELRVSGKETVGSVVVPGGGSLLLSIRTVPNLIELAPEKFLDYLKEEGLDEVIAWRKEHGETGKAGRERYSKFAKSLLHSGSPDSFFQHALGFPIEIIPLADPSTVRTGSALPVRVLFRGKPAKGFQLEVAWSAAGESGINIVGRTDANGGITIPIVRAGKWRLHSLHMERCSDPSTADWESYWASLTFETH